MNRVATRATPLAIAGQVLLYGVFALVIGVFSRWPPYHHLAADEALIKLSFTHSAKHVAECRQLSAEELAKLPRNMRAPTKCDRERAPVRVEVDIDGKPAMRHVAKASGLSRDGASSVYERLVIGAGTHHVAVRLKDSAGASGFDYQREQQVTLAPAQILVIDFDAEKGGITLQ
ncbi:MAG: hypothetical protein IPG91_04760 [Ideonella sp.]|nr:hypothetical protein [Ideonella sp.]